MVNIKKTVLFMFIIIMIFPINAKTKEVALSDHAKICLTCHSSRGINKILKNKEVLSLYINKEGFANSIHQKVDCNGCHTGYMAAHVSKKKKILSKKEYSLNASKICSTCHPDEKLIKNPLHTNLMKQAICVECHGAHYIKGITDWKTGINETEYCLTCHIHGLRKHLKSGEVLSLSINKPNYISSIHGKFSCSACHKDFNKEKHPIRTIKNKREYTALATKTCSTCHSDKQLRKSPVHSSLMAKATCVECHGAHSIKGIKVQKARATETQYCLSCHRGRLSMRMKNGESLSVYVDSTRFKNSAHGDLKCTACHSKFSKIKHPFRIFKNLHEYSQIGSKLCRKCHQDEYTQYEDSIHYTLFKAGNPVAPHCIDCHGKAHYLVSTKKDKTIGIRSCNKCHGELNSSYEASVHNKARIKGKANAPVCSSCHNAHDIESTKMTTKIKEGCFKCHTNMAQVHNKWLKNPPIKLETFVGAHFDVVSCAACHSVDAKRVIYLSLFDCKTGKPLQEEDITRLLNTDSDGLIKMLDTNNDNIINGKEFWDFFTLLLSKGVKTTFMGKMDVSNAAEAHMLGEKARATRDCETCHHPDSKYFKNVFIVISKPDGKTKTLLAEADLLKSVFSIIPMRKFYAIGGTNISLFDLLFYIALLGGIAVPIGHLSLRIIFSPFKALRRMGKGGKK